jgi:hypothetical protein
LTLPGSLEDSPIENIPTSPIVSVHQSLKSLTISVKEFRAETVPSNVRLEAIPELIESVQSNFEEDYQEADVEEVAGEDEYGSTDHEAGNTTISEGAEMISSSDDEIDEEEEDYYDRGSDTGEDNDLIVTMPRYHPPGHVSTPVFHQHLMAGQFDQPSLVAFPQPSSLMVLPSTGERGFYSVDAQPSVLVQSGQVPNLKPLPHSPLSHRADQTVHFRWVALPNFRFDMVYFGDKPQVTGEGVSTVV